MLWRARHDSNVRSGMARPTERPDAMTVRTNHVAFGDFGGDLGPRWRLSPNASQLKPLRLSRPVVEVHHIARERPPAVRTRPVLSRPDHFSNVMANSLVALQIGRLVLAVVLSDRCASCLWVSVGQTILRSLMLYPLSYAPKPHAARRPSRASRSSTPASTRKACLTTPDCASGLVSPVSISTR